MYILILKIVSELFRKLFFLESFVLNLLEYLTKIWNVFSFIPRNGFILTDFLPLRGIHSFLWTLWTMAMYTEAASSSKGGKNGKKIMKTKLMLLSSEELEGGREFVKKRGGNIIITPEQEQEGLENRKVIFCCRTMNTGHIVNPWWWHQWKSG